MRAMLGHLAQGERCDGFAVVDDPSRSGCCDAWRPHEPDDGGLDLAALQAHYRATAARLGRVSGAEPGPRGVL